MKIGIIGAGITGLSAAWMLHRAGHDVTVYEQGGRLGGHANTVDAPGPAGATIGVDTGFMVYNEPCYPNLTALLHHLEVATERSNMSFSVSLGRGRLEYAGRNLAGMYAQKRNLLSPTYALMLRDILRFHKEAPAVLDAGEDTGMTLGEYLVHHRYGNRFIYDHLLPMAAGIWSATVAEVLAFPVQGCVRFLDNHGLLKGGRKRPPWRTVIGGSRSYIRRLSALMPGRVHTGRAISLVRRTGTGAELRDAMGLVAEFDQLIIATHADQALALLADPSDDERKLLGAFDYQMNRAVLHRDPALMPKTVKAWSSWNYMANSTRDRHARVSVTYWMNLLQNLDRSEPLFVTLNPIVEPKPGLKLREFIYDQPLLDAPAMAAQAQLGRIQGGRRTWFCGAYCGYGFHEDALTAGLAVAEQLGARRPWPIRDVSPAGRNVRPPGHKLTPADGG